MANRSERVYAYLTPREKAELAEFSDELGKSQSEVVRDAVLEYLDHDKTSRVEEKVDRILDVLEEPPVESQTDPAHTHKQTAASKTVVRAREIAERIHSNHGDVVPAKDVKRAIEDIAGGDVRTIEKYEAILKERELLFEHPGDSTVWTPNKRQWVSWTEDYVNAMPSVEIHDVIDEYGLSVGEYDDVVESMEAGGVEA